MGTRDTGFIGDYMLNEPEDRHEERPLEQCGYHHTPLLPNGHCEDCDEWAAIEGRRCLDCGARLFEEAPTVLCWECHDRASQVCSNCYRYLTSEERNDPELEGTGECGRCWAQGQEV